MNPEQNRRILIVDDNRAIHEDFRKILAPPEETTEVDDAEARLLGEAPAPKAAPVDQFEIESAYQGQEALEMVRKSLAAGTPYAVAFVDMRMPPGWDGVETIQEIWKVDKDIQVVICTAYSDYSWEEITKRLGNLERLLILKKPFDTVEVCQLACALTEKWHLARHAHLKLHQLRSLLDERTHTLHGEIAERHRSEAELRQSHGRYTLALAGANDGIWDWDFLTGELFYSPRWKAMIGETEDSVKHIPEEWFKRVHPDDVKRLKADLQSHAHGDLEQLRCEYRLLHSDGQYRWMLCRGVAVRDSSGKPLRAAGSQTDITDRVLAEAQLRHDALHDPLTGLPNRALLLDRIGRSIHRVMRSPGECFAVIFFDLDHFKVINDSLGHAAGDQLLIAVSKRLESVLRAGDTLSRSEDDHLARLGGDEFVALLDSVRSPADAVRVADRLQQAMALPFHLGGHEVFASASFGVAISGEQCQSPEDILRDADTALYAAKSGGRGMHCVFDPQMHATALQRLLLESELRVAIEKNQLRLMYQPVQSLKTGQLVEVEALVRWDHPERGTVSPADFIPLAEETGLIRPIGYWALHQACAQLKQWQSTVPELADLKVAVNVSGHQFGRSVMPDEVDRVLKETGLAPGNLKLEITETTIMDHAGRAMGEMQALRDKGVQFHLDDFGTGYSSLSHLHRMPIAALKIDRSFVAGMAGNKTGTSIVQAIVLLARSLEMQVITEGVEDQTQADFLRGLGCDYAQGYFYSQALTSDELLQFACKHAAFPESPGAKAQAA
jgi:diguanylate cyclase (GGDEF)-like protein/PAS domain S-box-containing protein